MTARDLPDPDLGAWHQPGLAQMAGMEVVVVKSAPNGDVDLDDFRDKAARRATGWRPA
jgi:glycine cleavage system protein P-like pyridoxal-binding family